MDSIKSAIASKNALNNYILINDGSKMNVYFSNIDNLYFQNNNSGGIGKSTIILKIFVCTLR